MNNIYHTTKYQPTQCYYIFIRDYVKTHKAVQSLISIQINTLQFQDMFCLKDNDRHGSHSASLFQAFLFLLSLKFLYLFSQKKKKVRSMIRYEQLHFIFMSMFSPTIESLISWCPNESVFMQSVDSTRHARNKPTPATYLCLRCLVVFKSYNYF